VEEVGVWGVQWSLCVAREFAGGKEKEAKKTHPADGRDAVMREQTGHLSVLVEGWGLRGGISRVPSLRKKGWTID